jgi:hypothetical protein
MSKGADNPYSFAAVKEIDRPGAHPGGEPAMQYVEAYQFVFQSPNWLANLLLVLVAAMIPMIGNIIVIGYFTFVVQSLHFRVNLPYPDFDFNRFSDYLTRGIWPFLVTLVVSVVMVPLFLAMMFGIPLVLGLIGSAAGPEAATILAIIGAVVAWVVIMVGSFILNLIITAMILRAAWSEDFMEGLNVTAAWDFAQKMWLEFILEQLFMMVTAPIIALCGLLLLCVGYFLAIGLILFAQFHFLAQLYTIYLARGGIPIPVKRWLPAPGPYYGAPPSTPQIGPPPGNPPKP